MTAAVLRLSCGLPAVYVQPLAFQYSLTAIICQPAHRRVSSDTAINDGQVQKIQLALWDASATCLLCFAEKALSVSDIRAQATACPPDVVRDVHVYLCMAETRAEPQQDETRYVHDQNNSKCWLEFVDASQVWLHVLWVLYP